jgi:hypothetical protein
VGQWLEKILAQQAKNGSSTYLYAASILTIMLIQLNVRFGRRGSEVSVAVAVGYNEAD